MLLASAKSLPRDPRLHPVFRESGGAVGATATRIDDILGRGEPDL